MRHFVFWNDSQCLMTCHYINSQSTIISSKRISVIGEKSIYICTGYQLWDWRENVHISHNLTWYLSIVHKFTRIYPFCSTYELTKQFMQICVKNCAIHLKKNDLYQAKRGHPNKRLNVGLLLSNVHTVCTYFKHDKTLKWFPWRTNLHLLYDISFPFLVVHHQNNLQCFQK